MGAIFMISGRVPVVTTMGFILVHCEVLLEIGVVALKRALLEGWMFC